MKQIFGRSISLKTSLPKGYIIKESDIIMKKPYGGISFKDRGKVINAELSKDYDSNYLLSEEDLKNENKRKICIVIASRANFARIRSTALILNQYENVEVEIIAAGSALLYKYGKVVEQIQELFPKVYKASFIIEGDTPTEMAKSTGLAIIELSNIFDYSRPDIVLTIADRYETIATAIAASYMNIPLAHTQGGELTGSIDESVRHSITKLAHIHFPSTKAARKNLIQMGESSENIILSGCPSIDLALEAEKNFDPDLDLFNLYGGSGHKLEWDKEFLVVLQHPVTTSYETTSKQIEETVKAVTRSKNAGCLALAKC